MIQQVRYQRFWRMKSAQAYIEGFTARGWVVQSIHGWWLTGIRVMLHRVPAGPPPEGELAMTLQWMKHQLTAQHYTRLALQQEIEILKAQVTCTRADVEEMAEYLREVDGEPFVQEDAEEVVLEPLIRSAVPTGGVTDDEWYELVKERDTARHRVVEEMQEDADAEPKTPPKGITLDVTGEQKRLRRKANEVAGAAMADAEA